MIKLISQGQPILKEIEEKVKSKIKFWLLAPFAWNSRNWRNAQCLFIACTIAFALVSTFFSIAQGVIYFISSNNWLVIIWPILLSLLMLSAIPTFLTFSICAAIQSETDKDFAWLRCWLIITSFVKKKRLQSIEEIDEELTLILEPVSPREYCRIKERSKIFGKLSLLLIFLHIVGWIYLSFSNSPLLEIWRETGIVGFLYIGSLILAMAPSMYGIFQENTKKPVRVLERDLHLLGEPSKDSLHINNVLKNFENATMNNKLRRQARWFYYLGALCAWDIEKLPIAAISVVLLFSYVLINIAWPNFSNNPSIFLVRLFTVLTAVLLIYTIVEAWHTGGGKTKAMQRFNVVKLLRVERRISSILPFNAMLECFSTGSYNKPARFATVEDFVTKLYVKSLRNATKRV